MSLVEDENNDDPCAYCPLCKYKESKSMGCLGGLYHLYKKMFNDTKIKERCSLSHCQPKVGMEIKDKKEFRKENEK